MPGTYFEVIEQWNPADDLYIIQFKELQPYFAFVKPPVQKISKPSDNIVPPTTNPPTGDSFL
jgi:hypothetical protein